MHPASGAAILSIANVFCSATVFCMLIMLIRSALLVSCAARAACLCLRARSSGDSLVFCACRYHAPSMPSTSTPPTIPTTIPMIAPVPVDDSRLWSCAWVRGNILGDGIRHCQEGSTIGCQMRTHWDGIFARAPVSYI